MRRRSRKEKGSLLLLDDDEADVLELLARALLVHIRVQVVELRVRLPLRRDLEILDVTVLDAIDGDYNKEGDTR